MQMNETYDVLYQGPVITKASKALILLHGRGGTARGILSLANTFCDDHFYIAAPQAPNRTWYPQSFMAEEKLNEPYLTASVERIKNLIDAIATYIPMHQIFIMGFSQGACLTLEVTSQFATKYGGVIAFTGGLIGDTINEKKYHGNFEGTKVFIGNSDQDPHVPLVRSEQSKELMEKLGADVTLKVYKGMAHTINEDEISWVKKNIIIP
jgi:phospholipase/carboxylesterase